MASRTTADRGKPFPAGSIPSQGLDGTSGLDQAGVLDQARACEDLRLIESLAQGSRESLSQIYRLHSKRVFRAAYQHASSREMAEEVTQETFLLLLREPGKFDPARGELGAFLAGVARQLARRALSRTQAADPIEWDENASPVDSAVADVLDDMIARQEYRRLHEAIGTLPEPYRQTLVLHHLEGLPYDDVAEMLGCPVGTIRSRLARARELLARKLEAGPVHSGGAGKNVAE